MTTPFFRPSVISSFLLHCDGTQGSTTFLDSSVNNYTVTNFNNDVYVSTAVKKFGTGSAFFGSQNTDMLTVTNFQTNFFQLSNWTFDCWMNIQGFLTQGASECPIFSTYGNRIAIRNLGGNTGSFLYNNGTDYASASFSLSPVYQVWAHYAAVRSGPNLYLFINGVLKATLTPTFNSSSGQSALYLGNEDSGLSHSGAWANMDEIRIVKNTAVWTTGFTPPSSAYTS